MEWGVMALRNGIESIPLTLSVSLPIFKSLSTIRLFFASFWFFLASFSFLWLFIYWSFRFIQLYLLLPFHGMQGKGFTALKYEDQL